MKSRTGAAFVSVLLVAVIAGVSYADRIAKVGAGYKAKILCSEIFVAGRDPSSLIASEFENIHLMFDHIGSKIDDAARSVTTSLFGLGRSQAIYREGYGCTLAKNGNTPALPDQPAIAPQPWPHISATANAERRFDIARIDRILIKAFENNEAEPGNGEAPPPAHRGFVVVIDGKIAAERYADGFSKDRPFLSWSMAKSVTATLVGAAARRGYIDIHEPVHAPEWASDAARARITWNDLLQMQSGLEFTENYEDPTSDANRMLFVAGDASHIALDSSLRAAPGEHWSYSSGTTNLLSRALRLALEEQGVDYHLFAREALFQPIGATSFILEPDAAGNFVGSSFAYATARDWARLGQLYLQDGIWNGKRLLPEGWTDYVRSPARASDGRYGAHFWLNFDSAENGERWIKQLPESVYTMAGHEGQYVFIIPDRNMVVVRTGQTRGRPAIDVVGPVVGEIYDAVDG